MRVTKPTVRSSQANGKAGKLTSAAIACKISRDGNIAVITTPHDVTLAPWQERLLDMGFSVQEEARNDPAITSSPLTLGPSCIVTFPQGIRSTRSSVRVAVRNISGSTITVLAGTPLGLLLELQSLMSQLIEPVIQVSPSTELMKTPVRVSSYD